jgi:NitT/TauT family transport system permease protein
MTKSIVPRYARPAPARVQGLPAPAWTVLLVVGILAAVETVARAGAVSPLDLVPVTEMLTGAQELLQEPGFVADELARTLVTVLVSFALAGSIGVLVAFAMSRSAWCRSALQPYLNVFYALPIFALYPVLVVLLGTGVLPVVLLATTFSIVAVISNSLVGFDNVPPIVAKLSRSLQLDRRKHLTLILLPAALPDILAGLKLALAYAIIAVLASEFILAPHGLGRVVANSYNTFNTPHMYAGVLFVVAFALIANLLLGAALARFDWRRR